MNSLRVILQTLLCDRGKCRFLCICFYPRSDFDWCNVVVGGVSDIPPDDVKVQLLPSPPPPLKDPSAAATTDEVAVCEMTGEKSGDSRCGVRNVSSCGIPPSGDSERLFPADRDPEQFVVVTDGGGGGDSSKEFEDEGEDFPQDLGRIDSM
jgi:hypothetical protein